MHEKIIILILFFCSGLLFISISIPLILKKIPPNQWYGFRTPSTLADKRIWYDINTYSAKIMCALGIAMLFISLLFYFLPMSAKVSAFYCSGIFLTGVLAMIIFSFIHLRKIK